MPGFMLYCVVRVTAQRKRSAHHREKTVPRDRHAADIRIAYPRGDAVSLTFEGRCAPILHRRNAPAAHGGWGLCLV